MISEKIDKWLKNGLPSILAWKLRGSRVVSSFPARVMTGAGYKELENREDLRQHVSFEERKYMAIVNEPPPIFIIALLQPSLQELR